MTQELALDGMLVVDLSRIMAGPFCTLLLADMGADVIKVEAPQGGDDTRRMGPPFVNGESAAFLAINRNKRGLALDLKSQAGREVFESLIRRADVLVENFRPGTMDRLGLGYETLAALNPALIYCAISGFGQTGPYASRGGFDLIAQGMSGIMSVTGEPGGPPVKVGVPITDLNAGLYAAYAVLAAYVYRLRTGQGQFIDISLLEAGIAYTFWESASYFASGQVPLPMGTAHRLSAPYQAFPTSDGYITVGGANQATWEKLCRGLGRLDLLGDPRFQTSAKRTENRQALAEILEPIFRSQTSAYWLEALEKAGVPAGPIYNMHEVYQDPHVQYRGIRVEMDHPRAGHIATIGIPMKLTRTPGCVHRPAPMLGEHTDEVLTWLGYDDEAIADLRSQGVIA